MFGGGEMVYNQLVTLMKKFLCLLFVPLMVIFSCQKTEEKKGLIGDDLRTNRTTATICGQPNKEINQDYTCGFNVWEGEVKDETKKVYDGIWDENHSKFYVDLTDLMPGTTYYFEAWYIEGETLIVAEMKTFKTWGVSFAIDFDAVPYKATGPHSVKVTGSVYSRMLNGATFGLMLSKNSSPTADNSTYYPISESSVDSEGNFSRELNNLNGEYYCAPAYVGPGGVMQIGGATRIYSMAINLGLSVEWASCNMGARKPWFVGNFYAWGDVTPESGSFTESNYIYPYAVTTNLTDVGADAARSEYGSKWRMPTAADFTELYNGCTKVWVEDSDRYGWKFKSTKTGYTDQWIFIPAGGYRNENGLQEDNTLGYYWTSEPHPTNDKYATHIKLSSSERTTGYNFRYYGMNIRPVYKP